MEHSNPDNPNPFRRMCLVVIGYVTAVYVSIHIFKWTIKEVMETEPGMFIMLNAILAIVLVSLLVLAIDEINEYIHNKT